jgi:hypothetical protein
MDLTNDRSVVSWYQQNESKIQQFIQLMKKEIASFQFTSLLKVSFLSCCRSLIMSVSSCLH